MPPKVDVFHKQLKKLYKEDSDIAQIKSESSDLLCNATRAFIASLGKSLANELMKKKEFNGEDFKQHVLQNNQWKNLHSFVQQMTVPGNKLKRTREKTNRQPKQSKKRGKINSDELKSENTSSCAVEIEEDEDYDESD